MTQPTDVRPGRSEGTESVPATLRSLLRRRFGLAQPQGAQDANLLSEPGYRVPILVSLIATLVVMLFYLALRRGDAPPTIWIFWAALPFIVLPGIVSRNSTAAGVSLGLFAFVQCSGYWFSAPYGMAYYRDPLFNMYLSTLIANAHAWTPGIGTLNAFAYSFYPGANLYHVGMADLTGLDMSTTYLFAVGLVRFAILPLSFFRILRRFLAPLPCYVGVTVLLATPSNLFGLPVQQEFAIAFATLTVYAGILAAAARGRRRLSPPALGASLILVSTVVVSHYFTAYVFGVGLVLLAFVGAFGTWRVKASRVSVGRLKAPHPLFGFVFVAPAFLCVFFVWSTFVSSPIDLFWLEFAETSFGTFVTPGELSSPGGQSLGGVRAGFSYTTIELVLIAGALLVIASTLLLGLRLLLRRTRDASSPKSPAARAILILFILSFALVLGSGPFIFTQGLFIPLRILEFAGLGIIPLVGLYLAYLLTKPSISAVAVAAVAVAVVIVGGSLVQLSNPRFDYLQPQAVFCDVPQHLTTDVAHAAYWARDHVNVSTRVFGDELVVDTFGGLSGFTVVPEHWPGYPLFNATVLDANLSSTLGLQVGDLIVVDAYMYNSICFASFQSGPMDPAKLAKFETSPLVAKIFENGSVTIYQWEGSQ